MSAYIIAVGDEILSGRVLDYNSHWVSKRLASLGFKVIHRSVIPDDVNEIAEEINNAFKKGAKIIVLIGGLGPTPGDITLEGVAKAIGRKLVLNETALEYVKRRYEELCKLGLVKASDISEPRRKMAYLPEGAEPIYNAVGAAPGVFIRLDNAIILCLPGPPQEAFYVFEQVVPKLIALKERVHTASRTIYIEEIDETTVADILKKVSEMFPDVYIKTFPTGFGKRMEVTAIATGKDKREVEEKVEKAINEFLKLYNERKSLSE